MRIGAECGNEKELLRTSRFAEPGDRQRIVVVDAPERFLRSRFLDGGAEAAENIVTAFPQLLKAIEVHQLDVEFRVRQRKRPP